MIIAYIVSAVLLAFGLYAAFTVGLPSHSAMDGVDDIFDSGGKGKNLIDRIIEKIVSPIEPHIHLNEVHRNELAANLKMANINVTPEYYIISTWIRCIPFFILGLLCCFKSVVSGICFVAAGCVILYASYTEASRKGKERRYNLEAELPFLVSHIINSIAYPQPLYSIILKYYPIAGKTMKHELGTLLTDMRTGDHENALKRFMNRSGSTLVTQFALGLISLDRGEDMTDFFEGFAKELKSWRTSQLGLLAAKRPRELFVTNMLLFLGITVLLTVAIFAYLSMSFSQMF